MTNKNNKILGKGSGAPKKRQDSAVQKGNLAAKNTKQTAKTATRAAGKSVAKSAEKITSQSAAKSTEKTTSKPALKSAKVMGSIRSDMALELVGRQSTPAFGQILQSCVDVDKAASKRIGKPEGVYLTLETDIVKNGLSDRYPALSQAICESIRRLAPTAKNVLVVCLGNPSLTADALGSRVFENLIITRHLPKEIKPKATVSALCPNVMGATGIESFDIIKGVTERINPQLVIAVDSLASAAVGRIASAFQLCSSGITPGSGVANHRLRLDKSSLGVDVISIGVPLVVYASTIIAEAAGADAASDLSDEMMGLIVTPKDIDLLVDECAKVIAAGINKAFVE